MNGWMHWYFASLSTTMGLAPNLLSTRAALYKEYSSMPCCDNTWHWTVVIDTQPCIVGRWLILFTCSHINCLSFLLSDVGVLMHSWRWAEILREKKNRGATKIWFKNKDLVQMSLLVCLKQWAFWHLVNSQWAHQSESEACWTRW